jgi:hypothetical protein
MTTSSVRSARFQMNAWTSRSSLDRHVALHTPQNLPVRASTAATKDYAVVVVQHEDAAIVDDGRGRVPKFKYIGCGSNRADRAACIE